MTDERIWDQASIGERVEMLRDRVISLEHESHGHSRHDAPTPLDKRVDVIEAWFKGEVKFLRDQLLGLSGRVGDIEEGYERNEKLARHYENNVEFIRRQDVTIGRWKDMETELARLRRIEEAARELIEKIDQHPDHRYAIAGPRVNTLRAALDSEPSR